MGYRGIRHRSQPIIPIFLKTLTLICQAWVWAQQSILFGVFLISLSGTQLQNPQWTLPFVYRSLSWSEKRIINCLLHEISYSRTSSKFTYFCEMWCDGAYSWVCRIAMFLYYFSYAFTKRKDEIVHVKKPSPNLDNKISSHGVVFFPCASLAQFCNSSPDIRQLEFTFFSAAIHKEVSPALRLAEILY